MEGRLAEEDLGEAGLDGVGEAEVAEGEVHQLKTLLIEFEFLGRYSGGGRRGGSLPKAAVAAWGGYQVKNLTLPNIWKHLSTDWNSNREVWRLGSRTRGMELRPLEQLEGWRWNCK